MNHPTPSFSNAGTRANEKANRALISSKLPAVIIRATNPLSETEYCFILNPKVKLTFQNENRQLCDGFKETSRILDIFFIKVSKNERRTYLTNFIAVSISNGHKTKLNSNFVLALSFSY